MTTVERVSSLCKERKIPVSKLEKDLGFSNGYIRSLKKGTFPQDRLFMVADYFGVTPEELATGKKPSFVSELDRKYQALDEHGKAIVDMVLEEELRRCAAIKPKLIRHYLYSPAAGVNGLVSGSDYEDVTLPDDAPDGADFCLTVSGDSMEPFIHDGQLVYVKEDAPLRPGDVGVFYVDGATYIKQFFPSYDGSVYLLSANPKREDANITIAPSSTSSLVCFGKVLIKRLPMPSYE